MKHTFSKLITEMGDDLEKLLKIRTFEIYPYEFYVKWDKITSETTGKILRYVGNVTINYNTDKFEFSTNILNEGFNLFISKFKDLNVPRGIVFFNFNDLSLTIDNNFSFNILRYLDGRISDDVSVDIHFENAINGHNKFDLIKPEDFAGFEEDFDKIFKIEKRKLEINLRILIMTDTLFNLKDLVKKTYVYVSHNPGFFRTRQIMKPNFNFKISLELNNKIDQQTRERMLDYIETKLFKEMGSTVEIVSIF